MNQAAYEQIINILETFLADKGYRREASEDLDYFTNDSEAVSIEYHETKKLFILKKAELKEGEQIAFTELSSWLFDDKSTEKDARSIGNDFVDTLKMKMGISEKKNQDLQVDIPSKAGKNQDLNIDSFTGKFLSVFPQHKDDYKNHVAHYGEFLYDEFYRVHAVPLFISTLQSGNRKQCEKMIALFNDGFLNGDNAVTTTVIYTIMVGTLLDHPELGEKVWVYTDEKAPYLQKSVKTTAEYLSKPARRKQFMI